MSLRAPAGLVAIYRKNLFPTILVVSLGACVLIGAGAVWRQFASTIQEQKIQSVILASRLGDYISNVNRLLQIASRAMVAENTSANVETQLRRVLLADLGIVTLSSAIEHGGQFISVDRLKPNPILTAGIIRAAPPVGLILDDSSMDREIGFSYRAARSYSIWFTGRISTLRLSEAILSYGSENRAEVYVIDEASRIIAHPNAQRASRRESMARYSVIPPNFFLNVDEGSRLTKDLVGHFWLTAESHVPGTKWRMVVERPAMSAFVALWDLLSITAVAMSLALAVAWIATRQLSRSIALPIVQLKHFADQIEAGDFSQTIDTARNDEIGSLASTLKRMATTILENYRHLESKIDERTKELASVNSALVTAGRHKSEFLAHMSHELRTPLNAVIGFSDLLKAQYFGPLNQKQSEYVRDINASGQHLLSLINDILDLAKVEAGRMELMVSDCHVASLVESCVSLVSERVSRSRQTLTTDVASDVATWPLDERKVKQCLLNLLTNASKFTPVGGAIAMRVWVASNELVAAVSDNGVGIAADDLPKLFSEFYQAKTADVASGVAVQREGTGLGLALTKGFVELHGGTISVESVVGTGSTFTIRFPDLADEGGDKAALANAESLGAAK